MDEILKQTWQKSPFLAFIHRWNEQSIYILVLGYKCTLSGSGLINFGVHLPGDHVDSRLMLWQLLTHLHTPEAPEGLYKPLILLGQKLEQETFSMGENSKKEEKAFLHLSLYCVFAGRTFTLTSGPAAQHPCGL